MSSFKIVNTPKRGKIVCELTKCPKCGKVELFAVPHQAFNSVSRRNGEYICPACGTAEAMEDYARSKS